MVTLIDSPFANVANIARALRACGGEVQLTRDPAAIASTRKLVLPGVGAFAAAMAWLRESGVEDAIREAVAANGASLLGICVGHQLLFDRSHEQGLTPGLGLIRGEVRRFEGELAVPQIGWNRVRCSAGFQQASGGGRPEACTTPLFDGIADGTAFYFVNSYAVRDAASSIATADYDGPFTAAVQQDRIFGVQFHPEKSSTAGLRVLRNFIEWN